MTMERRKPIVGGVKFSAHVAMKQMKSVPDEQKSTREIPKCFCSGSRGSRTPDPLLVRQTL